jgi:hypothetical protein
VFFSNSVKLSFSLPVKPLRGKTRNHSESDLAVDLSMGGFFFAEGRCSGSARDVELESNGFDNERVICRVEELEMTVFERAVDRLQDCVAPGTQMANPGPDRTEMGSRFDTIVYRVDAVGVRRTIVRNLKL